MVCILMTMHNLLEITGAEAVRFWDGGVRKRDGEERFRTLRGIPDRRKARRQNCPFRALRRCPKQVLSHREDEFLDADVDCDDEF